jgi:hypothetical protein
MLPGALWTILSGTEDTRKCIGVLRGRKIGTFFNDAVVRASVAGESHMSYDAMKPKYSKQIPPRAILSTKISYGQD